MDFVRDMQFVDSWYLEMIGPRPVMFFKTKKMYFKFKINYKIFVQSKFFSFYHFIVNIFNILLLNCYIFQSDSSLVKYFIVKKIKYVWNLENGEFEKLR